MAGYALGYADGGAIPDDEDEDGGVTQETPEGENYTPPPQEGLPEPDEASEGALPGASMENPQPSVPMQQGTGAADALAPDQYGSGVFKKGVQAALAYLKGADAAPPQVAQKFSQGVKSQHPGISDDDANLVAVQKAYELGGPDAAHALLQFNRVAYNAKQSFALAALTGNQSKPADPGAAALAATQASNHVLDGSQASFQPSQDGFTATVKIPGTTRLVKYDLTPAQFAQYLNPAGAGQWDKLMQGGIPAALDQTTKGGAGGGDNDNDEDNPNDKLHIAANLPPDFQDTYTKGDEYPTWLKARADEYGYTLPPKGVFGTVPSSNATARQQYMDTQENQYLQRKAALEGQIAHGLALSEAWGARALGTENAAKTRAGAQVQTAGIRAGSANRNTDVRAGVSRDAILAKVNGQLNKIAANRQNLVLGENGKNARADFNAWARNNPTASSQEVEAQAEQTYKKFGLNPGFAAPTSVTTQPQMQRQQQQQVQAPDVGNIAPPRPAWVPDGAKFFRGQWYTRGPQGEAVPVQQPR